jgi:hypothetical protein
MQQTTTWINKLISSASQSVTNASCKYPIKIYKYPIKIYKILIPERMYTAYV